MVHLRNFRTFIHVLAAVAALTLPSPVKAFFLNRCPGTERCGFFGFFVVIHAGTQGTDQCEEFCVFFPSVTLECGSCSIRTEGVPSPTPIDPQPIAPTTSQYDISMSLVGIPSADEALFTNAALRWESVIVGDLQSVARSSLRFSLGSGCTASTTIDDVYICARYVRIDGSGRVLGSAGPADIRSNSLPVTGEMRFDSADINTLKNQGNFESVILHEMGHILGIGTLWEDTGATGTDRQNCPYRGPRANAEFSEISGCSVAPTEQDGGPGTRCGHWDEDCMGNELMTGFADVGNNPLSRITIASLEDIGYDVDYSTADTYGASDLNSNCICRRRTLIDMIHGETHQFGLRQPGAQRRKLSDELFDVAMLYGKEQLTERMKQQNPSFGSLFDNINNDTAAEAAVQFAANDVIAVFVMENGRFYDVIVRSDS